MGRKDKRTDRTKWGECETEAGRGGGRGEEEEEKVGGRRRVLGGGS